MNQLNTITTETLPTLLARAGERLLAARSSAEVLEAKKLAELALHYSKVTKAANETHADCIRIIARAEIRMANEIDKGQASGELATQKDGPSFHDELVRSPDKLPPATLSDLGVSRQRVSEWREIRDAGEDAVEEALTTALDEGRTPTKSDVLNHVRGTFGTGENEWYTPVQHIEAARAVMGGIDLDPASSEIANRTVKAAVYFDRQTDGLLWDWSGRVWLNPPYAQPAIVDFIKKLVEEINVGHVDQAIALTHNYTDTAWFHLAAAASNAICFTRGRIGFLNQAGERASPTQGQAFFYFGPSVQRFAAEFSDHGLVVVRYA